MKFSLAVVSGLFFADHALAFVSPSSPFHVKNGSRLHMAADMPPANNNLPVVQANPYGQPSDVRYSDFLRLVNGDRIEKVTFSSDGTQLLGVDVDGVRLKIESLPNDPDLLTQLTAHKVSGCERVFSLIETICAHSLTHFASHSSTGRCDSPSDARS
jgi:cell division protease FtsH